jgi:endonuclease G
MLRTGPSTSLRTGPSATLRTNPSTSLRTGPSTSLRTNPSASLRRTASASLSMRFERTNEFIPDPMIPGTDFSIDYKKSGYDRGHLAPAADMAYSMETMVESFFYSNMSPQLPRFNRGVWKKLEMQVRRWANQYDSLYVVTGPLFDSAMSTIGPHRVAVPKAYYKVLLQKRNGSWNGIGFILPNSNIKVDFKDYATTIDKVEEITGIDFFHTLSDEIEVQVEKVIGF